MAGPARGHRFDLADIVRAHRAELEATRALSPAQRRALTDIGQCRTAALGGHLDRCDACGYEHPSYNSCRNRHCPKCQALAQERWIAEQRSRMLEGRYFHVVFTLPSELRALAAFSPRIVYDALFRAAGRVLLELGESRLGATIGATLVLHTWTRALAFHPHVHAIVTGGGLALDGTAWVSGSRAFLFPLKVMARLLRGKMIDALREAHARGAFVGFDDFLDPEGFDRLVRTLWKLHWIVYAKPAFASGHYVLEYLGRYTHRVALSNSRLLDVTPHQITFRTKGDGTETLPPVELLRRFVQHVLPDGFHKIRHVGLHASGDKRRRARELVRGREASQVLFGTFNANGGTIFGGTRTELVPFGTVPICLVSGRDRWETTRNEGRSERGCPPLRGGVPPRGDACGGTIGLTLPDLVLVVPPSRGPSVCPKPACQAPLGVGTRACAPVPCPSHPPETQRIGGALLWPKPPSPQERPRTAWHGGVEQ